MPIFEYKGFDKKGKSVKGTKEADGNKAVRLLLRREGILATDVTETGSGSAEGKKGLFSRQFNLKKMLQSVSAEELGLATRQLATLLNAGVPLVDSLKALVEQVDNQLLKETLAEVKDDVNQGLSLADAMAKHKVFTNIYVNMIRAGESSGALEAVLSRLAEFSEGQAELRSKISGAMMYPLIMIAVAILVLGVMLTTVVPKITSIFAQSKVQLPLQTRIVVGLSDFLSSYWWLIVIVVVPSIVFFMRYLKTPNGRARWDRAALKFPVFGPLVQMIVVARFSRTLATLLEGGVPLLTTLQIVRNVVDNDVFEKAIDDIREAVKEGEDISSPMKRSGHFPAMVTHMIAIGEKTGELEQMLDRIATSFENRVNGKIAVLSGLLSPFMILGMGGAIGFIAYAILMPIMQMSKLVR